MTDERQQERDRRSETSRIVRAIIPPLAVAVLTGAGSAWVSTWVGFRLLDQRVSALEVTNVHHVNERDFERLERLIGANTRNIESVAGLQQACRETVIALQKTVEFHERRNGQ